MKVVIRENTWLPRGMFDFGWGNGYVLIPKKSRFYGKHYDYINVIVDVHGGLTFSGLVNTKMVEDWGLDKEDEGKWCVGFDTSHSGDNLSKWSKEKVQKEAEKLKKQLLNQ